MIAKGFRKHALLHPLIRRNADGMWERDPMVEFDSDEEPTLLRFLVMVHVILVLALRKRVTACGAGVMLNGREDKAPTFFIHGRMQSG